MGSESIDQIERVISNQKYLLNTVKNLDERLLEVEKRLDDDKVKEIRNII